jgi:RsiW-degrading membrane proteinase PrsW (M82 family)
MASFPVLIAFLSGVLPALLWLFFWLLEDRCEPEPKRYIFFCFLLGGVAVLPVYYIEVFAANTGLTGALLLLAWAATEEVVKFGVAYAVALRSYVFDEPIDAVIYMVTAALGFSAIENALFVMGPLGQGEILKTIVTGDMRFIGAMLLHTLSSATIGLSLAITFRQKVWVRRLAALLGVILAISLHTLFNFFILGSGGGVTFWIFLIIWFGIIAALLFVERIKEPARDYC